MGIVYISDKAEGHLRKEAARLNQKNTMSKESLRTVLDEILFDKNKNERKTR